MILYRTLAMAVSNGRSKLSLEISHPTDQAAYELFTPNKSGQRLPPTYYRGCWHVVGRGFFCRYRRLSSLLKGVYNSESRRPPRGVAASGFRPLRKIPHCCLP